MCFPKVRLAYGVTCSLDICKTEDYVFQFDPANQEADLRKKILAGFFVTDVIEVNTEHHYINLEMGMLLGWRDGRLTCKNQVIIIATRER